MAKVTETPFVLPPPLAELRKTGIELFCLTTLPQKVHYWPNSKSESTRATMAAVVDAAERIDATPGPGAYRRRERIRLRKGEDTLDVDWEKSRTAVYLKEHRAATFDVYTTISLRWNGDEVLDVHLGGDENEFGERWQITAVKQYKPGKWLELVARMNDASK